MSERPIVTMRGVTKVYRRRAVLSAIDLDVHRGEVLGLIGPNGSGKTTSLRLMLGLTFRQAGELSVTGIDPGERGRAVRARCAYLPGETSLYDNMTGAQTLRFALRAYPRLDAERHTRLERAFALPLARPVHEYSAGMKQKLALLIALVPDVDLYLLDEPDRNLDPSAQELTRELVHDLAARGKTVLYCSHDLRGVQAVASRLVFFKGGHLIEHARIERAEQSARREVRILLAPGTQIPAGTDQVTADPDGYLRIRTAGDPLEWLANFEAGAVQSVEVGVTGLDVLYHQLDEHEGEAG